MNGTTYTPEQMRLAARFAGVEKNTDLKQRPMFELLMNAVLLGMEAAERNTGKQTAEQDSA